MSQSSDDAPTGPIRGQMQHPSPGPRQNAAPTPTRRWNIARDLTAAALLVIALLLPWNLYFGLGILGSNKAVLAVLFAVTLLSLISIAVAGSWRSSSARFNPALAGRLRLALNIPYSLLVLGFVAFDVFETVRFGGTVNVPGGVGPGAWLGIAGSLLGAQPVTTGPKAPDDADDTVRPVRIMGYASIVGAVLSFGFNLFWRVRFALHGAGGSSDFGKQNIAVIATAVVYGAVALAAVVVASRWLLRSTQGFPAGDRGARRVDADRRDPRLDPSRGRDIDAFHGIAQNTSTAGVGFEGYLAWAAAAAIFAPPALLPPTRHVGDRGKRLAGGGPKWLAAHHRMVPGVDADADHRPRRRREPELPVLALRQHGAGRVRPGHRGACDLAAHQPRQRHGVREADLVAVRTRRHAEHLPRRRGRRAGAAVRGIAQRVRAERGLRKQSRPADHQHLRRGALRAGAVHPRGGHRHRRTSAVGACDARSAARPTSAPARPPPSRGRPRRRRASPPAAPPRRRPRRRRASPPAVPAWTPPPGRCRSWPVRRESSGARKTKTPPRGSSPPRSPGFSGPRGIRSSAG